MTYIDYINGLIKYNVTPFSGSYIKKTSAIYLLTPSDYTNGNINSLWLINSAVIIFSTNIAPSNFMMPSNLDITNALLSSSISIINGLIIDFIIVNTSGYAISLNLNNIIDKTEFNNMSLQNNQTYNYKIVSNVVNGNTSYEIYLISGNPNIITTQYNTALGLGALSSSNLEEGENTAIGKNALRNTSSGSANNCVGHQTMVSNTNGSSNCAIGNNALSNNISGCFNTAIGISALYNNTTGNYNTAIGIGTMMSNGDINNIGDYNTAVGAGTLQNNTTGNYNTAVGFGNLINNINGSYNSSVGHNSSSNGSYNSGLGYWTNTGSFDSCVVLGAKATATANSQFVVGSTEYPLGGNFGATGAVTGYWSVIINGVPKNIALC